MMRFNETGITRLVFEFKTFVVKIPNWNYSWEHFLKGIVSNISENKTWKYNSGKYRNERTDLLCPVIWCSWGGWILVMEKADVITHYLEVYNATDIGDIDRLDEVKQRYKKWIDVGLGGDDKCSNYGYLNGILVKIDYP